MIFAVFIITNSGIMANKKTDMSKLRQILRLHEKGESKLKISELTGVSRNTLKKYLKIYQRLGLHLRNCDQELDELFGENLLRSQAKNTKR
jgi:DNA-binding NarL/FixJ family response regulator